MRAIWSGALSFGLVNIPIKLFSAVEPSSKLNFDMLHKKDLGPIRYARVCRIDGQEIPYQDIVKGYEYQKGDYVVLTEEDFKKADVKKTSTVNVIEFIAQDEVDPMLYEKPYFLAPQRGAEKPYQLLREALFRSKKVGLARFVLRSRERLATISPKDDVLVLTQLRFGDELRKGGELAPPKQELAKEELAMAISLVDQLTKKFNPADFSDTYTEKLEELIEQKASGKEFRRPTQPLKATEAQDIMAMLRQSLEQERQKQAAGKK